MSVVVAHQASAIGHLTLQEAAKEANLRQAPLAVIHVAEGVDLDVVEAHKAGVGDEITKVLAEVGLENLEWTLQVTTGEDVAEAVLDVVGRPGHRAAGHRRPPPQPGRQALPGQRDAEHHPARRRARARGEGAGRREVDRIGRVSCTRFSQLHPLAGGAPAAGGAGPGRGCSC